MNHRLTFNWPLTSLITWQLLILNAVSIRTVATVNRRYFIDRFARSRCWIVSRLKLQISYCIILMPDCTSGISISLFKSKWQFKIDWTPTYQNNLVILPQKRLCALHALIINHSAALSGLQPWIPVIGLYTKLQIQSLVCHRNYNTQAIYNYFRLMKILNLSSSFPCLLKLMHQINCDGDWNFMPGDRTLNGRVMDGLWGRKWCHSKISFL